MYRPDKKKMPVWKLRWVNWRNGLLGNPRFQNWAARNPLLRPFARRKARELFDLVAGFTYTQTLYAALESGLIKRLAEGPCSIAEAADASSLSEAAADRLLRAAGALGLAEEIVEGQWMLGQRGASLLPQAGAQAMIRHHALLYRDLADPLDLLKQDRKEPTELSEFWRYAARGNAEQEATEAVNPYSQLMAASQAMVASEVLNAYSFNRHKALLDVGGGHGAFVGAVAANFPTLKLGIFDLPGVIEGAGERLASSSLRQVELHQGNFFHDPLPQGYDCISLVRILHDHDDDQAQQLLNSTRAALPAGGRLVIAEPLAGTPGSEAMGEAYFGLYLWAMRSGRPRTRKELESMLHTAGFRDCRAVQTDQPLITSIIVALA